MVANTRVKIYVVKSRHSIFLSSDFIKDSAFPFVAGEELTAKISDKKIVIERPTKS